MRRKLSLLLALILLFLPAAQAAEDDGSVVYSDSFSVMEGVSTAFSAEPMVETRQAVRTANTSPTIPTGKRFSTIVR